MSIKLLDGRVVIVTGAGRGLGRAHALELAAHGATVIVNNRRRSGEPSTAEKCAEIIRQRGGNAEANLEDVSTWEGGTRLVEQTVERFGRLDGIVNNAGGVRFHEIADGTEELFDEIIDVHLRGVYAVTSRALAHWRSEYTVGAASHEGGSVVNTTSSAGLDGRARLGTYGASKAAVLNLTDAASQEGAAFGVRANAIAPQGRTRMVLADASVGLPADTMVLEADEYTDDSPVHPQNSSPLVAWLLSSASEEVTGCVFRMSGPAISVCRGWTSGPPLPPPDGLARWPAERIGAAVLPVLRGG